VDIIDLIVIKAIIGIADIILGIKAITDILVIKNTLNRDA
jgi:hypothetical protein